MKELNEHILERRRQCLSALNNHLMDAQNQVYNVCTIWAENDDTRTPEECFSSLHK